MIYGIYEAFMNHVVTDIAIFIWYVNFLQHVSFRSSAE